MMTIVLLTAMAMPCPDYCTKYSFQLIVRCMKEADAKHLNDRKDWQEVFSDCLEREKNNVLYKRCARVCEKGNIDGEEKSN